MFAASAIIRKVLITTALTTQVEPNNRDSRLQKYSHAKRYKAAQIVTLPRQIEMEIANGKTPPQVCKEAGITVQT